ncbi:hypothetical protein A2V68_03030 [candidate division Kazan bacterium RBG_13_50_9]|uniref:Vitamin K epoxide reductase domain-containing protein n=1 Tax=candidate division Kazan bacterium RBG_13_50_9 TaxID=1798535 RepID=A0A1F4NT68_UNCK3|nr:MAG: hypothetical protein A2V68_03030 [candidate division Kazan bacterium RBG_13_50_9]
MYWLQALILVGGTIFAWWMVSLESAAGMNIYASTCTYGAIAFAIALIMALYLLTARNRAAQKWLTWLLGLGAIFGWSNFAYKVWQYYQGAVCASCPPVTLPGFSIFPPLGSPCFYGASLFTLAFIVAILIYLRKNK